MFINKGFGIYFVENDIVETINFDLISVDTAQNSRSAVRGFRILRKQAFFKEIEKQNYVIWCDCGPHFRSNEMCAYFFKELAQLKIHGFFFNYYSYFYI